MNLLWTRFVLTHDMLVILNISVLSFVSFHIFLCRLKSFDQLCHSMISPSVLFVAFHRRTNKYPYHLLWQFDVRVKRELAVRFWYHNFFIVKHATYSWICQSLSGKMQNIIKLKFSITSAIESWTNWVQSLKLSIWTAMWHTGSEKKVDVIVTMLLCHYSKDTRLYSGSS